MGGGGGSGGGGGGGDLMVGPNDILLTMDTFRVEAGEEVYRCQNFANPLGADIEVQEWESDMTQGSHHLLVFYEPNAQNSAVASCSGLEFASGPYGAQTPRAKVTYPAGVAAVVKANQGLRFASHYLNASPNPVDAVVRVVLRKAQPGSVQHRAGVFFFNNLNIFLQANPNPQTLTKTCKVPRDVYFLYSTGHMHKRGKNLTAKIGNMTIYSTNSWDFAPFEEHAPPLFLPQGTDVTFTCTVLNTDVPLLTFGDSADTNEMCIYDGQFYPDPTGNGLGC
jgi:hypothetical protein